MTPEKGKSDPIFQLLKCFLLPSNFTGMKFSPFSESLRPDLLILLLAPTSSPHRYHLIALDFLLYLKNTKIFPSEALNFFSPLHIPLATDIKMAGSLFSLFKETSNYPSLG